MGSAQSRYGHHHGGCVLPSADFGGVVPTVQQFLRQNSRVRRKQIGNRRDSRYLETQRQLGANDRGCFNRVRRLEADRRNLGVSCLGVRRMR